jgi:hypothetical protein
MLYHASSSGGRNFSKNSIIRNTVFDCSRSFLLLIIISALDIYLLPGAGKPKIFHPRLKKQSYCLLVFLLLKRKKNSVSPYVLNPVNKACGMRHGSRSTGVRFANSNLIKFIRKVIQSQHSHISTKPILNFRTIVSVYDT